MIREFTVKKPNSDNEEIYRKLKQRLNLKATSFADNFIEIACEDTDDVIKQTMIELGLEYSSPWRDTPVLRQRDIDGIEIIPDDFILTQEEQDSIKSEIQKRKTER